MSNLLLLTLSLTAGWALRARVDPRPFTVWVLYVALPAVTYTSLRHAPSVAWPAVASAWLAFFAAWGVFTVVGRVFGWSAATVGCLTLACGLSNTSFVGFPLLEALLGPESIAHAVPIDQLGSFLLVATVAPIVAARAGGQAWQPRDVLTSLRFPALPALVLALLLPDAPTPLVSALERIGATLSPIALFAIGAQLRTPPAAERGPLVAGLTWKLLVAPMIVLGWVSVGGPLGLAGRVTVLEAAMAPMVTGALLAQSAGLRPELAAAFVGIGVPVSFATVWGWALLTR